MPKKTQLGFEWYGDEIKARMLRAAQMGVNRTMAVCVVEAKQTHPFENRTGTAERSLRIWKSAQVMGDHVFGIWGSVQTAYFKFLELNPKFATLVPTSARVYPILGRMVNRAYAELRK